MQTFSGVSDLFINLEVSTLKGFSINSAPDSFLPLEKGFPALDLTPLFLSLSELAASSSMAHAHFSITDKPQEAH